MEFGGGCGAHILSLSLTTCSSSFPTLHSAAFSCLWLLLFTHSIPARLPLSLPLMSCFLPLSAVVDWVSLQTIQCTKGVEGAWVLRQEKLLCLAETITAATSVLPSFSRDWPASFVLLALSLSFSLVLHPVMSSCIYLLLVIVSNKDTPRL